MPPSKPARRKSDVGIPEVVVSAKRPTTPLQQLKKKLDRASNSYSKWQEENPGTKLVADTFPVSNWGTGVADILNDAYTGNYAAIPADALSLVPGVKTAGRAISAGTNAVRNGTSIIDALKNLPSDPRFIRRMQRKMTQVGRLQDSSDAADQAARNEMGYAKGGMVRKSKTSAKRKSR